MADRTRRFIWGLGTGYVLTAANVAYTLFSIPLALHFLSKEQFGLWALVAQLATYMNLVDFGMQSSASRIFINYKDNPADGNYGSLVKTSFFIFGAQGLVVLAFGFGLLPWLAQWMSIPAGMSGVFKMLMGLQFLILAIGFTVRTFGCLLHAHQQLAWANLGGAFGLLLGLGILAITLSKGWGMFSLAAAGATSALIGNLIQIFGCVRLRLLPASGAWGQFQLSKAYDLFRFGRDTFLMALGWQLISASPTILVSKLMGLEAAATWAIGTKLFSLVQQVVWRVYDFATSGFSEMFSRGEMERLKLRFFQITSTTVGMAGFFGGVLCMINSSFIRLWTDGEISWPPALDIFLGLLLFSYSFNRCYGGLVGVFMDIGFAKYAYFLDGLLFVLAAYFCIPFFGFFGVLIPCLVLDIFIPGLYSYQKTARFFGSSLSAVFFRPFRGNIFYLFWVLFLGFCSILFCPQLNSWSSLVLAGTSLFALLLLFPIFIPRLAPAFMLELYRFGINQILVNFRRTV
jgi:O-antigen/teichoic acid export membrane protein